MLEAVNAPHVRTYMRLTGFRVTNFRSVIDSGWVEASTVNALIGVNESGKSNLLLPLWKLNPAREGEIQPTSDYPKTRYAAIKSDPGSVAFIEAEFLLDATTLDELIGLTARPGPELERCRVSRTFSGEHLLRFPDCVVTRTMEPVAMRQLLADARRELESMNARKTEATLKDAVLQALDDGFAMLPADAPITFALMSEIVVRLQVPLAGVMGPGSSFQQRYAELLQEIEGMQARLDSTPPEEVDGVLDLVTESIPKFVYYSNYGNLDSEIYLPHVVSNLKGRKLGSREEARARTLRTLFSFVRLEPEEILELGQEVRGQGSVALDDPEITRVATRKRERTILLHSAGSELTRKFRDWWKQGDYTFDFQADGDHFRIWVSDDRRPAKVELEDRSTGLQWFLCFYLVFLVESEGAHNGAILLLDEPGLSLHPLAQRDLFKFFENLSTTNQIFYTTHSPFLVDADMLDQVRKVYVAEDGSTKASSDLRRGSADPRGSGASYAIHSALNMSVAESILLGCRPVIVEGPSDQHYLTAIKLLLIGQNRIAPRRDIVFPPSHGAANAKAISSILAGRDEELPFVLLDGDAAGRKAARELQNGNYQSARERVLSTDSYCGLEGSEVEDLFPAKFVADAVDRMVRGRTDDFRDVVRPTEPIVQQVERWAVGQDIPLPPGWKVELAKLVKGRSLTVPPETFDDECLERWTRLFRDIMGP